MSHFATKEQQQLPGMTSAPPVNTEKTAQEDEQLWGGVFEPVSPEETSQDFVPVDESGWSEETWGGKWSFTQYKTMPRAMAWRSSSNFIRTIM